VALIAHDHDIKIHITEDHLPPEFSIEEDEHLQKLIDQYFAKRLEVDPKILSICKKILIKKIGDAYYPDDSYPLI